MLTYGNMKDEVGEYKRKTKERKKWLKIQGLN
jgi:hypothetical protein